MGKTPLNPNSEFVVGEERVLNYVLAILCLALFLYGLVDAIRRRFIHIDYQSFVFALALGPAYLFFKKARSRRIYIRINKTGIYHYGKLITRWSNFIKATVTQKEKTGLINIQDNFLLVIEFRKEGTKQGLRYKIPLTNTQNKSEEEVLAAVRFFWKAFGSDAQSFR